MNSLRKILIGGAIAGSAVLGGAVGASLLGTAGAQTTTTTAATATAPSTSSSSSSTGAATKTPDWTKGGHQANGKTETVLTGSDLAKANAAAEAAVPGATPQRAESDAEGATYEVHMTKADGSVVTVKLDSTFTVTSTIDGMG